MTKKPKIAIFHCGFIYSGGGERIVLQEAKNLIKRGYQVCVYAPTLDENKCYPKLLKELKVKMFLPSFIDKLPLRNAIRMTATSLTAPLLSWQFRDIDVFIGANQPGAWLAFVMAKILQKPYLVYLNQPNRLVYPRPVDRKFGWYSTVKDYQFLFHFIQFFKPIIAWLDRISITKTSSLLVNGSYIGDIVENIYAVKTVNAPAGSYLQPLGKLKFKKDDLYKGVVRLGRKSLPKPYLLVANRHDPQKRFDYVIKALASILSKYPGLKLIIPGPFTAHTQKLIDLAKKLAVAKNIYFLGQVTENDLQKLYSQALVHCYPSPEEDFGLGPIEAGAWGVPSVAWRHAGPTVTIKDGVTGFLAKPFDVKDYAKKIMIFLNKPLLRRKMGKAAWKRTRDVFPWYRHIDILENEIEIFLKKRNNLTGNYKHKAK